VPICTYQVVDPSTSQPLDRQLFEDDLLTKVKSKMHLVLTAKLVPDELSARRAKQPEIREFSFRIYEIHPDPLEFFVNVQDIKTNKWISIRVGDDIRFTVVS
jgi:hypothetical protein